jgi:hypothetical protein
VGTIVHVCQPPPFRPDLMENHLLSKTLVTFPRHSPTQPSVGSLGYWLVVPISFYLEAQWRLVPGPSGPTATTVLVVMLQGA